MKVLCLSLMAGDNGFTRPFRELATEYREIAPKTPKFNEHVKNVAKEFKPDLVFIQIQMPGIIKPNTVVILKQLGAIVVNWTGDVRHPIPPWYYQIGKEIDSTMFTNMTDVEKMRESGYKSDYLEIGIDPDIYSPNGPTTASNDIVYFGNNYGAGYFPMSAFRIGMVDRLKGKFPNFGVYGSGWPNGNGSYNASQPQEAAAYRGSKIAINVSHFVYKRYSSDRLLRIMGSGTMCLCMWYPDMPFEDGVHLRTWKTLEELEELIIYYMDHEEERKQIAEAGCEIVHKSYTFKEMIKNLIKFYESSR